MNSTTTLRRSSFLLFGLAILAGGILVACGSGKPPPKVDASLPVRGCVDRAEGGVLTPNLATDSVAGNLAFMVARSNFRSDLNDLIRRNKAGLDRWVEIKILALLKAGSAVDVEVPDSQESWLRLAYIPSQPRLTGIRFEPCDKSATPEGRKAECVTEPFTACASGITQFNGALVVNFGKAPRQGRCARVLVRKGNDDPESLLLFSRKHKDGCHPAPTFEAE